MLHAYMTEQLSFVLLEYIKGSECGNQEPRPHPSRKMSQKDNYQK